MFTSAVEVKITIDVAIWNMASDKVPDNSFLAQTSHLCLLGRPSFPPQPFQYKHRPESGSALCLSIFLSFLPESGCLSEVSISFSVWFDSDVQPTCCHSDYYMKVVRAEKLSTTSKYKSYLLGHVEV